MEQWEKNTGDLNLDDILKEFGSSALEEDAPEALGAGKGIKICAEWECSRLPGRKMPLNLRGRCSGGVWGRKGYQNLRGMGHPAEKC